MTRIEHDRSAAFTPLQRATFKQTVHFTGLVLMVMEAGKSPRSVTVLREPQ